MTGIDSDEFRRAMASFATGITVVTTVDGTGRPWGLTANAFASVSLSPPLCLVCVARDADAYPAMVLSRRFAVNVLSKDQQAVSARFATHGLDKFADVPWTAGAVTGCPLLPGGLAFVECEIEQTVTAGDHDVFFGKVLGARVGPGDPLLYFRSRYGELAP